MFPPDISDAMAGSSMFVSLNLFAYIWPSRWFTPIKGTPKEKASPFAKAIPTTNAPTRPGAYVDEIASISLH